MEKKLILIRLYLRKLLKNLKVLIRWTFFSIITGLFVGAISTLFAFCLHEVTGFRTEHTWLILLLPVAGLLIVFLYQISQFKEDKGTNLVLTTLHAKTQIPFRMAPLIFVSTIITHLFGGSAGREGAALQLGGSLGQQLGKIFRFDEKDQRIVVMCGMSAAFSAIFGTPIAASVFSMEVASIGVMYYAALVPCVFSSLTASLFAVSMGIGPDVFTLAQIPEFQILPACKVIVLGLCCAVVSALFCISLHSAGDFYKKYLKNPYIRILVSSAIIILLTILLQTSDYMGAGVPVIERAMEGIVSPSAFLLKILFTALTLAAGFKGGEIVPSFFIGATFGCLFGQLCGISPSLCAAVGMMAVFCGVTNCPITSLLISFELFGYQAVPYFLIGVSVSYLMSGYYSLYHDQKIIYSKYKTEYINRNTK